MNPAFMDAMSWEMAEVYGAITDQIMINMAHYFPYWKPGQPVPASSFEYQATMLAQMGQVNRETVQIIRNGLQDADEALKRILEQAIIDSVRKAEPDLLKGVMNGILKPAGRPILSPNQARAFQLYYQQAANKLNLVNTVMLESTEQAYMGTVTDIVSEMALSEGMNRIQIGLDTAAGETITGVSSWNQAVRHGIDRMKDSGIVGFIDHAGHRWSAEAYVSMDVRTTVYNTGRAAVWEANQAFGNDLYIVSYHDGARPLCFPWQNKVISSTDTARTIEDLDGNKITVIAQSATSYGQAAGLFGVNCKHYPSPFIPGVSVAYDQSNIQDEKANDRVYQQTQEQRSLERKIREKKRDLLMAKAQGASADELRSLRDDVRQISAQIDEFCDSTGLPRRKNREGVYTKREFPAANTYNPKLFTNEQQKIINQYFTGGGSQQGYTFGQMTPNPPPAPPTPPAPPAPAPNVAQQTTLPENKADTINTAHLDAKNFPDSFNKKKTKAFVDAINATEGVDPDVVELYNTMGAQVNGAAYPVKISYTEDGHAVGSYRTYSGKIVRLDVKVPKVIDPEFMRQEIGTTAHEWGHLFDHLNGDRYVLSYTHNNRALSKALENARPMSDRIRKLIDDAVREGNTASQLAMDAAKAEIEAISNEITKALSARDFTTYTKLAKQRDKLWKDASRAAEKASRKAHNGRNAIEDIYDAISGGTLRDKTNGLYGHGSRYYKLNPGGENAATETLANYCSLALAYPDLFKLMAEEQPEIWEACGNIVRAMLGR